jgi:hypothetical protein
MELTKTQETYPTCAILKGNLLKGLGHLSSLNGKEFVDLQYVQDINILCFAQVNRLTIYLGH